MFDAAGGATARVPAWKKLGLKLKQSGASEPAKETLPVGHPSSKTQQSQSPAKRKHEAPPERDSSSAVKKPRTEKQSVDGNAQLKKKKTVTFGDTPTKTGTTSRPSDTNKPANPPQPKKSKGAAKKQTATASTNEPDIKPALGYLKQWNSARDSWKFNKNHQSALIKHLFDPTLIPATDIDVLYAYLRDLKGFVRTRLQETAMEIKKKDSMQGAAGFPEGTVNLEEKHMAYEAVLAQLLHAQSGKKRKVFNEVEYRASSKDVEDIIQRVVKRMRSEMVLDQLSDSEETETSRSTASSETMSMGDSDTTRATDGDKRMKPNDGSGKRRRKLRVNVDDSSSEEEDDDSDTSSSGSSDDDDDDDDDDDSEDKKEKVAAEGNESSSSSSSEDDSDDESEDEDA